MQKYDYFDTFSVVVLSDVKVVVSYQLLVFCLFHFRAISCIMYCNNKLSTRRISLKPLFF